MKKIFLTLTAVLLAGILFTSASPSLDGRAVVAAEGVFPRGYFAKTVGYLPGDSIKVTNPVNGARIDILVIGSLDASDGVAILLSPEAAEALSIKMNSNNLVKLTKRNGTADDVVSGSALITKGEDTEELAEELAQEEIEAEEIAEELALLEDESEEDVAEIADEISEDEIFEENAEEFVRVDDEISEEIVALPPEYEYIVADDIPDDSLENEESEDFSERVNEEEIQEEFVFENEPEKVEEAEIAEELAESESSENEISEDLAENEGEEIPELSDAEENALENEDEYDAIVLVPSEENPPAPREESDDKKENVSSEKSASVEETPAPKSEKSYAAATELAPRKYYVQIAVYNEAENVEEVNELYGKRYPLVVLEKGRLKTVLVGPFNVDEYGIILERFKAYGFKDAFVKSTF